MDERERLIDLLWCIGREYDDYCDDCHENGLSPMESFEEMAADHLLANGAIVPPCKVGDTVWFIRNIGDKSREKITETSIEKVVLKRTGIHIKLDCNSMYETSCNSIGKTVFLSREEAEKALKERSEGE